MDSIRQIVRNFIPTPYLQPFSFPHVSFETPLVDHISIEFNKLVYRGLQISPSHLLTPISAWITRSTNHLMFVLADTHMRHNLHTTLRLSIRLNQS